MECGAKSGLAWSHGEDSKHRTSGSAREQNKRPTNWSQEIRPVLPWGLAIAWSGGAHLAVFNGGQDVNVEDAPEVAVVYVFRSCCLGEILQPALNEGLEIKSVRRPLDYASTGRTEIQKMADRKLANLLDRFGVGGFLLIRIDRHGFWLNDQSHLTLQLHHPILHPTP